MSGALEPIHGAAQQKSPHMQYPHVFLLSGETNGFEERPHHLVLGPQPHILPCQRAAPTLHVLLFKKHLIIVCEMEGFGGVPSPTNQGAANGN